MISKKVLKKLSTPELAELIRSIYMITYGTEGFKIEPNDSPWACMVLSNVSIRFNAVLEPLFDAFEERPIDEKAQFYKHGKFCIDSSKRNFENSKLWEDKVCYG